MSAVLTCVLNSFGARAWAEIIVIPSDYELQDRADVIVVASPAETQDAGNRQTKRFIVHEVLRGDPILKSQWIRVDMQNYQFGDRRESIRHALLFLRRSDSAGDAGYLPVLLGVRYLLTNDRKVLVPFLRFTSGPFSFRVEEGADWEMMLKELREVLPFRTAMRAVRGRFHREGRWVELKPSTKDPRFAFRINAHQIAEGGSLFGRWPSR
jgi:hypothetical protein